jgi:GNAT superfamily N-acetyltransferase
MTITIRQAHTEDAEIIARFNEAIAWESEGVRLDGPRLRRGVAAVLRDAARGVYYLAERGGEVVGQTLVTYEWSDWRNGVFWWIQSVYVEPAHREAGVFRRLFEHVRDAARRDSTVCGLRLYVDHDNERARQVYRRLGLTEARYAMMEEDFVLVSGE